MGSAEEVLRKGAADGSDWALGRPGTAGTAGGLGTVTGEREMEDKGF